MNSIQCFNSATMLKNPKQNLCTVFIVVDYDVDLCVDGPKIS